MSQYTPAKSIYGATDETSKAIKGKFGRIQNHIWNCLSVAGELIDLLQAEDEKRFPWIADARSDLYDENPEFQALKHNIETAEELLELIEKFSASIDDIVFKPLQ